MHRTTRGLWRTGEFFGIGLLLFAEATSSLAAETVKLHVVDEAGAPVDNFQVMSLALEREKQPTTWTTGERGIVEISPAENVEALDIVARSDGYATRCDRFQGDQLAKLRSGDATMMLSRGETVRLKFKLPDGLTWSEQIVPTVYLLEHQKFVNATRPSTPPITGWRSQDFNELNAELSAVAEYTVRLASDSPEFVVGIHHPGFLRFCDVGPFMLADAKNGAVEVALPRPATLRVQVNLDAVSKDLQSDLRTNIGLVYRVSNTDTYSSVAFISTSDPRPELSLNDLPQGNYRVAMEARHASTAYYDSPEAELAAGERKDLTITYAPLDRSKFKGERTAVLKFIKSDGSPLADTQVTVAFNDPNYRQVLVLSQKTPASGVLDVPNLADRLPNSTPATYCVESKGEYLGQFLFENRSGPEEFTFKKPPAVGEEAPDLELTNVDSGEILNLSELRGKVVYIDFWATWCGACREPLAYLDRLAAVRNEDWKDRTVILPVNLDERIELISVFLQAQGLSNLTHYWSGKDDGLGYSSPAAEQFVLRSIPTALLIGRDGKILWRGHPGNSYEASIESRIEGAVRNQK